MARQIIDKLYKIAEALHNKFPEGDDPFRIVTRLAEECGEVAAEVNHFEDQGVAETSSHQTARNQAPHPISSAPQSSTS